jgi:hypothetical protein
MTAIVTRERLVRVAPCDEMDEIFHDGVLAFL